MLRVADHSLAPKLGESVPVRRREGPVGLRFEFQPGRVLSFSGDLNHAIWN